MFFQNIYETGLAQASYFIGCQATGEALVIDPRRDIDVYLELAEKKKLQITHIAETHIHADYLSGSRELAAATGAKMYLSDEGGADWQYQFEHIGLKDGDTFKVGNIIVEVMHTPGHTPEHISFLVTDGATSDKPIMMFTGDFVFVGDIGRPDLLEKAAGITGTMEKGAREMFQSVKKFKELPDYIQVWPAHGAGSACGKALGAIPSTTVGYEKMVNWAMNIDDEDTFVERLLDGQPEPPKYFAMMKKLNKEGADILGGLPVPEKLTIPKFDLKRSEGVTIVDTRNKFAFAGGHIPGSINIQDNASLSTWAGWLLDYENPFILVAPDHRIEDVTKAFIRIGLDRICGYVTDMEMLTNSGQELEIVKQMTVADLKNKMENDKVQVIDVRGAGAYNAGHIDGAVNIHTGYIPDRLNELDKDKEYVVHCVTGATSCIACSVLLANGFTNVTNLTGGISVWNEKKYPLVK